MFFSASVAIGAVGFNELRAFGNLNTVERWRSGVRPISNACNARASRADSDSRLKGTLPQLIGVAERAGCSNELWTLRVGCRGMVRRGGGLRPSLPKRTAPGCRRARRMPLRSTGHAMPSPITEGAGVGRSLPYALRQTVSIPLQCLCARTPPRTSRTESWGATGD